MNEWKAYDKTGLNIIAKGRFRLLNFQEVSEKRMDTTNRMGKCGFALMKKYPEWN